MHQKILALAVLLQRDGLIEVHTHQPLETLVRASQLHAEPLLLGPHLQFTLMLQAVESFHYLIAQWLIDANAFESLDHLRVHCLFACGQLTTRSLLFAAPQVVMPLGDVQRDHTAAFAAADQAPVRKLLEPR
ncbi:MAG: hypothetical protein SFY96_03415 [Planctomycetota bacterium]|nr:hypothetical protein [Planctomycetota bacterium]